MQENGLNWHFLTSILCVFFQSMGPNCFYICFKSVRYVVYETTVKKYGIESAVTFGKSKSRSHVREK